MVVATDELDGIGIAIEELDCVTIAFKDELDAGALMELLDRSTAELETAAFAEELAAAILELWGLGVAVESSCVGGVNAVASELIFTDAELNF